MSGTRSKRKGKHGESTAATFLKSHNWYIADKETQGLSGDDIFARSPDGVWFSIEVKNTNGWTPKYVQQAKRQARERKEAITLAIKEGNEVLAFLRCDQFDSRNWLVMWHPSNVNARGDEWVVAMSGDKGTTRFLAPFKGVV